jgi:hypothetical protein
MELVISILGNWMWEFRVCLEGRRVWNEWVGLVWVSGC